jgi:uncharacterized Zn-finger protein
MVIGIRGFQDTLFCLFLTSDKDKSWFILKFFLLVDRRIPIRIRTNSYGSGSPDPRGPKNTALEHWLKVHRMRHDGVRPHPCTVCSKRFLDTETLRVHMRRHEGVRPFTCHTCRKGFVDQWGLTKHQRTHHVQVKKVYNIEYNFKNLCV